MKIGPLGPLEIIIILIVILIIFGPKNLPKLGAAIGKAVKNLREGIGSKKKTDVQATEASSQSSQAAASASSGVSTTADQPKTQEAEVIEVIDKPEPGRKAQAAETDGSSEEKAANN